MMVVIVLLLIALALLIHWAIAHTFCEIARMKGHSERKYYWWCFSGLPGWLMVIALPDRNTANNEARTTAELPEL